MAAAQQQPKPFPKYMKFVLGGAAGCFATVFVQPLDLVKNRMQTQVGARQSSAQVILGIIRREGLFAMYNGLSAGMLRQATYTTTRLGVYTYLFERVTTPEHPPNFAMKMALGMTAGVTGAFVGTPAEVSLIRMTSDGRLPAAERRNYSSVFDALLRMAREEGVRVWWRGAVPTMGRAAVVNAAQLATYSQAKQSLLATGYFADNLFAHFCSAMISGFVTSVASMPVDIAKTRIQNMKYVDGKPEYTGAVDVLGKLIRNEGVFALWKGFMPYFMRLGPHTVLTFVFLEHMTGLYRTHVLGDTSKRSSL